jgi:myosin-1
MMNPEYFRYLSSTGEYDADGIDDMAEYKEMRNAMSVCLISDQNQMSLLEIVAAVLHLGNIDFFEEENKAKLDDMRGTPTVNSTYFKHSISLPIY